MAFSPEKKKKNSHFTSLQPHFTRTPLTLHQRWQLTIFGKKKWSSVLSTFDGLPAIKVKDLRLFETQSAPDQNTLSTGQRNCKK
jgi:hypothetical protein